MRKVPRHLGVAALAALGMLGLWVQAAVASDPQPDCAGQPQNIRYAWVQTEPDTQFAVSEISGGAVLCGSDTQTERAYLVGIIRTPDLSPPSQGAKGMTFRCANPRYPSACTGQTDIPEGRFVGNLQADVMRCSAALGCWGLPDLWSYVYVHKFPSELVPDNADCGPTYGGKPVVACLQGADSALGIGWANMLVTRDQDGGDGTGVYKLYMFQPKSFYGLSVRLYYTKLGSRGVYDPGQREMVKDPTDPQEEIHICKYAGPVGGTTCGSNPDDWLQKNGARQAYGNCAPTPPGGVLAAVPWSIEATRNANWPPDTPPSAKTCTGERWAPTAGAAGAAKR